MKFFQQSLKNQNMVPIGNHAARATFADAILCAVCGGLYGMVFGALGATVRHEVTVSGLLAITGYGAITGFAFGVAVGAFREVSSAFKLRQPLAMTRRNEAPLPEISLSRSYQPSIKGVAQDSLICGAEKAHTKITAISG